jgi:hypothetical protein
MPRRARTWRSYSTPLLLAVVAAAAIGAYFLVWSPNQRTYFKNRDLRLLGITSSQIQGRLENLDNMMDHSSRAHKDAGGKKTFFEA